MRFVDNVVVFCHKHDSLLFAIGEIALGTAAVIFAVKNTEQYISDREEEIDQGPKPVPEKAKDIVTHYWPTMVCYGSLVALRSLDAVYTNHARQEYAKALVAAQSALLARSRGDKKQFPSESTQNENLPALQGEEMQELRVENAYDQYNYQLWLNNDEMPDCERSVYLTPNCMGIVTEFYIPALDVYFLSTMTDVQNAENSVRMQLQSGADVSINEMLKYLGLGSRYVGYEEYMEGDPEHDEICGDFSFDLLPARLDLNDGFGSVDCVWTINPNRLIRNKLLDIPQ